MCGRSSCPMVTGSSSTNAATIRCIKGSTSGRLPPGSLRLSGTTGWPVRSFAKTDVALVRAEPKKTRSPRDAHTGNQSVAGCEVTLVNVPRGRSRTQMSGLVACSSITVRATQAADLATVPGDVSSFPLLEIVHVLSRAQPYSSVRELVRIEVVAGGRQSSRDLADVGAKQDAGHQQPGDGKNRSVNGPPTSSQSKKLRSRPKVCWM